MFNIFHLSIKEVNVSEVKKVHDEKTECAILDVRSGKEYGQGHLEGSINIPIDEIRKKINSVIKQRDKKLFVYCLSGSRSFSAVKILDSMGYTNVYNMKQGIMSWRKSGYPLV